MRYLYGDLVPSSGAAADGDSSAARWYLKQQTVFLMVSSTAPFKHILFYAYGN